MIIINFFLSSFSLHAGSLIRYAPDRVERFEEDGLVPLRIIVDPPYFETFMFEMFSEPFEDGNDLAISEEERERKRLVGAKPP